MSTPPTRPSCELSSLSLSPSPHPSHRSFYSSERFSDLMIPTSEDWEAATGEVRVLPPPILL
jgi:hypothetical protein